MPGIFPSESHTCVNLTSVSDVLKMLVKAVFFYLINLVLKISGAKHGRLEPVKKLKQNPLLLCI